VDKSLNRRWLVVVISCALFMLSALLVPFIGGEFITESDRAELMIALELPPGTPLEKTRAVMQEIEGIVHTEPEVEKTFATVGKSEGLRGKSAKGVQLGQMLVGLSDKTEREKSAFAIIFTLPLAMIGVWMSLYLAGMTFSIFSLMAIVMLFGYVVNNAILIMDSALILRNQGMDRHAALVEACKVRLRPILMTTLTTIFGMLPLALAIGCGTETRAPMAVVFIGGLFASTLLTLFVIPVIYTYLDDVTGWIKGVVNWR